MSIIESYTQSMGDQGERPRDIQLPVLVHVGLDAGQRSLIALDAPETVGKLTDTGFVIDPLISPAIAANRVAATLLGIGAIKPDRLRRK